jgi:hypothetical protein
VTTICLAENASVKSRKKLGTLSPLRKRMRSRQQKKQSIFHMEMKMYVK